MEITPKVLEECVLPRVSKPNRYIFPWAAPQLEFAAASGRVCVLCPATYESGLTDARLSALVGWLTRLAPASGVFVDVVFRPGSDLAALLRGKEARLFGLASGRPLAACDLILAVVHDPLQLASLAHLLELGGVAPLAADRGARSPAVIVAGDVGLRPGPAVAFADRVVAGDPEAFADDVLQLAVRLAASPDDAARHGALALFDGEGVWGAGAAPAPRWLDAVPTGGFPGVPPSETDENALFVEIARPCGIDDPAAPPPPVRVIPAERVPLETEHGLVESGLADVVFAGTAAGRHPALETVLEEHHQRFAAHGVTGRVQAVDPAHFSPGVAREQHKARCSRLEFVPVAVSERLRAACGRPLGRADLVAAIETALRGGWGQVRLGFVVGVPGETPADRLELFQTLDAARALRPKGAPPSRLHVNLVAFTPTPALSDDDGAPAGAELLHDVEAEIRRRAGKGGRLSVTAESAAGARARAALWRGGAELVPAVLAVARDPRLGSDGEPSAWAEALSGIAPGAPGPRAARPGVSVPAQAPPAARRTFGVPSWASTGRRVRREGRTGPGRRADRYRIRFSKSEPARFTSHLDVGRALERAFRRAQLPVAWTQGKEPRPKVAFGPPLPLGMTSDAEYLDVVFGRDVPESFLGAMSDVLPEGLALTAAAPVRNEAPSLASVIQLADYEVWFPDSLLEQELGGVSFDGLKERLESRVAEVKASDTFEITRVRKERTQTINARPSLGRMDVVRDDGGRPVLSLSLTLNQPDSIRPEPLTAALCDWAEFDERLLRVHRTGLHIPGKEGPLDPLDVVRADFAWWRQPIRGGTVL